MDITNITWYTSEEEHLVEPGRVNFKTTPEADLKRGMEGN